MIVPRSRAHNGLRVLLGVFIVLVAHCAFGAQDAVPVTEITTKLLVFSTTVGNVVASMGPDGALLVGRRQSRALRASAASLRVGRSPPFGTW